MGWIHDTGYPPAYEHEGYVAAVLTDDTTVRDPAPEVRGEDSENVRGWRPACSCGWQTDTTEFRGTETAPDGETQERAWADWQLHLRRAVPEIVLHDLVAEHGDAAQRIDAAVRGLRAPVDGGRRPISWERIGAAAGITKQAAWERWRHLVEGEEPSAGGRRLPDPTPEALAAAVDGLEGRGPVATARRAGQGWQITITDADEVLDRIDVDHEWGPASMGHRLIEHGWIVCAPAVHVRDRAAGWAERDPDTHTAPVSATTWRTRAV